jgi:hypothetical protein
LGSLARVDAGGLATKVGCVLSLKEAVAGQEMLAGFRDLERRRQVLETPTSSIDAAPETGRVEIKGTIVAGEDGILPSPFGGEEVVWFRIRVEEERGSGKHKNWAMLVDESGARTFYVDDSSSQKAKVVPFSAHVLAANTSSWTKPSPRILAFLRERELETTNRSRRYKEERLVWAERFTSSDKLDANPARPRTTDIAPRRRPGSSSRLGPVRLANSFCRTCRSKSSSGDCNAPSRWGSSASSPAQVFSSWPGYLLEKSPKAREIESAVYSPKCQPSAATRQSRGDLLTD